MGKIKPMSAAKRKRLEAAGFHETTVAEFLGLTPEEEAIVEVKVALCDLLVRSRKNKNLTQYDLADILGVSQPRVVKIETDAAAVGLDATLKALFAAGVTRRDIAKAIAGSA